MGDFFRQFYSDAVFATVTGLTPPVFSHIFTKYGGSQAPDGLRTPFPFFQLFNYLKT